jgi:hypothetical protein
MLSRGAFMARSRDNKEKKTNRLLLAIPLIALVAIAAIYIADVYPSSTVSVAMNFTDQLLIEVQYKNNVQQYYVISPNRTIGEPGGFWQTHQFDSYGISNYYPLYMDDPTFSCPQQHACTFHVKSNVLHQYTLGDYLAVWGYPVVGQNDTLGIKSSGNFEWELCIGPSPSQANSSNLWGALVLEPNTAYTLEYYDVVNGFGCAPT